MKKIDIVQELATRCDLTEQQAAQVLEVLFEAQNGEGIIARAIDLGDRLTIAGFGTFGVKTREAKAITGRGGQSEVIPAKRYAYFKPARPLRDHVASGPHLPDFEDDDDDW